MRSLRLVAIITVLGLAYAVPTTVRAADMPENLPPLPKPPARLLPEGSWYVRGDLGYAWGTVTGAESAAGFASPTNNSVGGAFVGGIGAGYKSSWLRTDLTVEYMSPMTYKGTIVSADDTSAKVSAVTALFNGYLDLGTWYRATPYLGAGVGTAYLKTTDYTSTAAPPFTTGLSSSQWNVAWAAMAGVGYAVAPNILVDVGYRYINFGDAKTASDASGAMTLKNLAAHQVRVGVRWSFDDFPVR